jgi:thiamine monophosphate synthase
MFAYKKKYFLIIESIKDLDLKNIKISNKFNVIYRNENKIQNIDKLLKFRKNCKTKKIDFYVSNNKKLALALKADGLYISAKNKNLAISHTKNLNLKIIGGAHNIKEINTKILQGCSTIFFSRLFKTSYLHKKSYLGLVKYNLISLIKNVNLVPLGGIRKSNLNKLKIVNCNSFALLSEVKKKPAITSRLF